MSRKKLSLLMFAAALVIAAVSCNKDDEIETLPALGGLYFNCPSFVAPKQVVRITPKGITPPEGKEVIYYWKVTPTMTAYDTTDLFVHWFSDTLQTYIVNGYAHAEGYSTASATKEVVVVRGGIDGSLTQRDILSKDPKVTVDGVDYYYKKIGGLDWFRNNLVSKTAGASYVNLEVTSDVFGNYFSYNDALAACPEGWRLPTEEDWMSLAAALDVDVQEKYQIFGNVASKLFSDTRFNGVKLLQYWPEVGDITNSSRLSMVPVGYANLGTRNDEGKYPAASFDGMFEYAVMWTADKVADKEGMAYYRYLIANQPEMLVGQGDVNTFGASVRCVRDSK